MKRPRNREWRVVKHENRWYLLTPRGKVEKTGGYFESQHLRDLAKAFNKQLDVERLVRRGRL